MTVEMREVPGHPRYFVTRDGRVQGPRGWLTQGIVRDGTRHLRVSTWHDNRLHTLLVARAVATAYLGPPPTLQYIVAHRDGNPQNNNVDNLFWTTEGENKANNYGRPRV